MLSMALNSQHPEMITFLIIVFSLSFYYLPGSTGTDPFIESQFNAIMLFITAGARIHQQGILSFYN